MIFPLEVLHALDGRLLRHGQDPAHLAKGLLGIVEVRQLAHFRAVLENPILAGQPRVQDAVLDVARHLLGADQHALDLLVVNDREIGAGIHRDLVPGAAKELERGLLKVSLG